MKRPLVFSCEVNVVFIFMAPNLWAPYLLLLYYLTTARIRNEGGDIPGFPSRA